MDLPCHVADPESAFRTAHPQEVPMSQRRSNVLMFAKSPLSETSSRAAKLNSLKPVMLPSGSPRSSPAVVDKLQRLRTMAPDLAEIVDRLVDDLLEDVS
jgi:hypothetical protein